MREIMWSLSFVGGRKCSRRVSTLFKACREFPCLCQKEEPSRSCLSDIYQSTLLISVSFRASFLAEQKGKRKISLNRMRQVRSLREFLIRRIFRMQREQRRALLRLYIKHSNPCAWIRAGDWILNHQCLEGGIEFSSLSLRFSNFHSDSFFRSFTRRFRLSRLAHDTIHYSFTLKFTPKAKEEHRE